MTTPLTNPRITNALLGIAVAFVAVSFALWTPTRTLATAVGAGLSLLNWFALRWLGARILDQRPTESGAVETHTKMFASILLMGKIGVLMGLVYVLINRVGLDPIGLAFGLGVLFVGPVVAGLLASAAGTLNASAATAARKER
jgi:hypothetical protein